MSKSFDDWPPTKQDNGRNWSQAKLTILRLLWPGDWVEGAKMYEATQQTYYDRRIRELRESGWHIETRSSGSNSFYRLCSHEKSPGNPRQYPNAQQKSEVWQRDNGICQICGAPDENMQYDHKIPLERHGKTMVENLQLLCRACNVEKRGACKHCKLTTCEGCPYAYPEQVRSRLTIYLDTQTAEQLQTDSEQKGISRDSRIKEILSAYYEDEQE